MGLSNSVPRDDIARRVFVRGELVLNDEDAALLSVDVAVATLLARAKVPSSATAALWLADGWSVVDDLLRRVVARTLAQQFSRQLDGACQPHQYAPATRTGAQVLVHSLQAKTQADPQFTVLA